MAIKVPNVELVDKFGDYFFKVRDRFPNEAPSFRTPPHFGLADQWMESSTKLFLSIPRLTFSQYQSQHHGLVLEIVEKIREKRTYYFFLDFLKVIESRFDLSFPLYLEELRETRYTLASFLLTELLLIWSLLEKEGRFLVCVQAGHYQRKYFPLPDDLEKRRRAIMEYGQQILAVLPFIGPEDLDLIPAKIGPIRGVDNTTFSLFIPDSLSALISDQPTERAIEKIIADALVRQKYIVCPEGVPVEWEKAGDLQETFMKERNGVVVAKMKTSQGEILALLNLDTAWGTDFTMSQKEPKKLLALSLAVAYWAWVTGKIKPGRRKRVSALKLWREKEKPILSQAKELTKIYIPRTYYTAAAGGKAKEISPQLIASHSSPIPHVRHFRKGWQMSKQQRRRIEAFEEKYGARILRIVGPNCTFVLPEKTEARAAIYCKSGIGTDIP